ncbi:unnamed protein product [Arabidopsis arenosa]|uniref:SWIM-type domain-containing protein n=1 Tax=Arabidopsis arenosa TaxID=38785 RepID=A0A8S1ZI02_ARAAE|nr:unnamed protein product [Arabidopsis arenosa]
MADVVLVLAGDWECSDEGSWDFVIAKNCMCKCILIGQDMTYNNLKAQIVQEFEAMGRSVVGRMSYWVPGEMSIFTSARTPPVSIHNDAGLQTFLMVRAANPGLNLLVTLEPVWETDTVSEGERVSRPEEGMIRLADATPSLNSEANEEDVTEEAGNHKGKEGEEEMGRGNDEMQILSEPPMSFVDIGSVTTKAPSTAMEPVVSERRTEIDLNALYDAELIAHIEMVEEQAREVQARRMSKGKDKIVYALNEDEDSMDTEECEAYVTDEEEEYDYNFWDNVIRKEQAAETGAEEFERGETSNPVRLFPDPCSGYDRVAAAVVGLAGLATGGAEDDTVAAAVVGFAGLATGGAQDNTVAAAVVGMAGLATGGAEVHDVGDSGERGTEEIVKASGGVTEGPHIRTDGVENGIVTGDQGAARGPEEEEALQATLANMYAEIIQAEIVPTHDCAPCFGDEFLQAHDVPDGVFDPANDAIFIGRIFRNKAEMQTALAIYAIKRFFNFKQTRSDKERLIVRCVDPACAWRVYGHTVGGTSETMQVKTAKLTHTCDVSTRAEYGKKASCKVIASVLQSKFSNGKLGPRAVDIPDIVLEDLRVSITYMKAWHAKEKAVAAARGSAEGSYKLLMAYIQKLKETNVGTVCNVLTTKAGTEKYSADLVFVSDRHNSIYSALRTVYPLAKHGACAVHLYRNVKSRFKRQKGLPYLVSKAAYAYTVAEFRHRFQEIERRSPLCANYLRGIGISHWTRVYFQGKRYNIMSSNVAECLNAALAKALEFPIVSMLESIRMMLMRWFYCRRQKANNNASPVTPEVEKKLMEQLSDSAGLRVSPASTTIYQVNNSNGLSFTVDLERKTCSCKVFDTLGIPCSHALAAARVGGVPIIRLVEEEYKSGGWINAYSLNVMPVPNVTEVDSGVASLNMGMLPPQSNNGPGRRRKRRIPSAGENQEPKRGRFAPKRCSRCLGTGHNRVTCKNPLP